MPHGLRMGLILHIWAWYYTFLSLCKLRPLWNAQSSNWQLLTTIPSNSKMSLRIIPRTCFIVSEGKKPLITTQSFSFSIVEWRSFRSVLFDPNPYSRTLKPSLSKCIHLWNNFWYFKLSSSISFAYFNGSFWRMSLKSSGDNRGVFNCAKVLSEVVISFDPCFSKKSSVSTLHPDVFWRFFA